MQPPNFPPHEPPHQPGALGVPNVVCSQCQRLVPSHETVTYQGMAVCAQCKPAFFQRIQEGGGVANVDFGQLRYAGFGVRFLAKLIDGIVLLLAQQLIQIPVALVLPLTQSTPGPFAAFGPGMLVTTAIGQLMQLGYQSYFIGKRGGTPGKLLMKLKVVAPDGSALSYKGGALRGLAELVTSLTCGIGYLLAINDPERRTLHDRIASTRVVLRG